MVAVETVLGASGTGGAIFKFVLLGTFGLAKKLSNFSARSTALRGGFGRSGFNSTRLYPPLVVVGTFVVRR